MKQLTDISSDLSFYLTLGFLFLIPFSIAACYILFTLLLLQLSFFSVNILKNRNHPPLPGVPGATFPTLPGYYKYFLLFILATFISTLFAIDISLSLNDNREFFIYLLIPLLLLVLNSRKRLLYSALVVLASALVSSLWGIVQSVINGINLDHRLQGATSHWMTYAGLLMFPFIFFFVYAFYEKRKKIKMLLTLSLAIILIPILLSLTRSVWVGIFIALGIFIIYYKPKILVLVIPVFLCLLLLLPGSVKSRLTSIFDMNNDTNKDRLYMVQIAVKIFKDYPLTGVGPNGIEKVYHLYKPAAAEQTNTHLHNNFLQILAERGIFALIMLLLAFGSVILLLIQKMRPHKKPAQEEKAVATAVLFVFIGFLIAGLFEYNFGDSEVKFLLFYFLSIPFLPVFADASDAADSPSPKIEGV